MPCNGIQVQPGCCEEECPPSLAERIAEVVQTSLMVADNAPAAPLDRIVTVVPGCCNETYIADLFIFPRLPIGSQCWANAENDGSTEEIVCGWQAFRQVAVCDSTRYIFGIPTPINVTRLIGVGIFYETAFNHFWMTFFDDLEPYESTSGYLDLGATMPDLIAGSPFSIPLPKFGDDCYGGLSGFTFAGGCHFNAGGNGVVNFT